MRAIRVLKSLPLAPRVRSHQEAERVNALQLLGHFRRALCPFTREPMSRETREHICDRVEVICGRMTPWKELGEATHLLVHVDRANTMTELWGMQVLGSPEVRAEEQVVVAAYRGIARGPLMGKRADRARIWFRPLLRLFVHWPATFSGTVVIDGVEMPDRC